MEAGDCLAPIAHRLEAAVTAVEWRRVALGPQFGPGQALGTVRLTGALYRADPRDPRTLAPLARSLR
jgi:hypothetical protein